MKWKEFKEGVRSCPDDQLHTRFGIYDNFTILVRTPWESFISLITLAEYTLEKSYAHAHNELYSASTKGISILACPDVSSFACGFIESRELEGLRHFKWMQEHYQMSCLLTLKNSFRFTSLGHQLREISQVCLSLGDTLQSKGISFCLPRTSWNNYPEYGKIVYWPDSDEGEMCRK